MRLFAVTKESKYKGDIFMVFDYAAHDLTGMQEATKSRGGLNKAQVSAPAQSTAPCRRQSGSAMGRKYRCNWGLQRNAKVLPTHGRSACLSHKA